MSARIHVVSQSTAKSLATARQPAAFDMLLPWKPSETPKVLQASERSVRDPMGASCISAQHSPGKFPLSKKSSNTSAGAESAPENQPPSRQQAVVCKASRAGPAFCSYSTIMAGGPRPAQKKGPTCKGKNLRRPLVTKLGVGAAASPFAWVFSDARCHDASLSQQATRSGKRSGNIRCPEFVLGVCQLAMNSTPQMRLDIGVMKSTRVPSEATNPHPNLLANEASRRRAGTC